MTGEEQAGLPQADRDAIAAELAATLAVLPPDTDTATITRNLVALLVRTGRERGYPGMFELACTAALMSTDGAIRELGPGGSPMRYQGFGPGGGPTAPQDATDYRLAAFITAVMHDRRGQGWELFCDLQPPHARLQPELSQFMAKLLHNAWSRQHGGTLRISLTASNWPPVCDFCCGPPGVCMWHVTGADVEIQDPREHGSGPLQLRMDDMEYWFACRPCRNLIARKSPDWQAVWGRHRANRPNARRADTMTLFKVYEQLRKHVLPVPLPDRRPRPSEDFLG